jgi:hypothetical protein
MKKFIVFGQQKSGTQLLRAYLNNHPKVVCYDELFVQKKNFDKLSSINTKKNIPVPFYHSIYGLNDFASVRAYLEDFFKVIYTESVEAVGFVIHYNQFNEEIRKVLIDMGFVVLHTVRDFKDLAIEEMLDDTKKKYDVVDAVDYYLKRKIHLGSQVTEVRELMFNGTDLLTVEFEKMVSLKNGLLNKALREKIFVDTLGVPDKIVHCDFAKLNLRSRIQLSQFTYYSSL